MCPLQLSHPSLILLKDVKNYETGNQVRKKMNCREYCIVGRLTVARYRLNPDLWCNNNESKKTNWNEKPFFESFKCWYEIRNEMKQSLVVLKVYSMESMDSFLWRVSFNWGSICITVSKFKTNSYAWMKGLEMEEWI